jgi:hypothetical protein
VAGVTGAQPGDATVTHTQAELDRLFDARAQQAKRAAERDMLAALGLDSLDAAKQAVTDAATARAAQMTELQKAQEAATTAIAAAVKAKAEKDTALLAAGERLMQAEVVAMAATLNFIDPLDAWRFVARAEIKPVESGEGFTGVKEAVEKIITARPYLIKAAQALPGHPAGGTPRPPLGARPAAAAAGAKKVEVKPIRF